MTQHRSHRKNFLFIAMAFAMHMIHLHQPTALQAEPKNRPNIILILADDLGYECLGANGSTSCATPNLDRLAATGARFEHCYVQPLCTPTRAQLMTGKYNVRNYIDFGVLDPKETTVGNLLSDAGYRTCIVGKWQLGGGFDAPAGFGFKEHCLWQLTRRPPRYANPGLEVNGKEIDYHDGEYGPELVNRFALDFIERHRDQEFFVYYPMILTHSPYQPTPDSSDWDAKATGERVNQHKKHFPEMVNYMDKMIGRVVEKLDSLSIRDNTMLIFVGDNGTGAGTVSMMGDRIVVGGKGKTTRAGMHVPLVVNWPATIKQPIVNDNLVDSTDFLPTICDVAGVEYNKVADIDGHSFLPQLIGQSTSPRQAIYSWYWPRTNKKGELKEFAFNKKYKLYRDGSFFNVSKDPDEKNPLPVSELSDDATTHLNHLKAVLAKYADVRSKGN